MAKNLTKEEACKKLGVSELDNIPACKSDEVGKLLPIVNKEVREEIVDKNPCLILEIFRVFLAENRRSYSDCYDICLKRIDNLERELSKTRLWRRKQKIREEMQELTEMMMKKDTENKIYSLCLGVLGVIGLGVVFSSER